MNVMIRVATNHCVMPSPKLVVLMLSFTEKSTEKELIESIMDIEDLVKNGNKHRWVIPSDNPPPVLWK